MVHRECGLLDQVLIVATLNTRGVPVRGSGLVERYAAIARTFEDSPADVVSVQEVHTYGHLRLLTRGMPSFRWVTYARGPLGPCGGVVTLSRRPARAQQFQRFSWPSAAGLPWRARLLSPSKGALVTRLSDPDVLVVNIHPTANTDGDWSSGGRFAPMHRQQLATVARVVGSLPAPVVVCGDFNVPRETQLHREFMGEARLTDAFAGRCPPTFHAEYLPAGRPAQCIDFLLVSPSVVVDSTSLMFTTPQPLAGGARGLVSDHVGLCATLRWSADQPA